jgi:hypothetical protein
VVVGALDDASGTIHHTLSARKGEDAVLTFLDALAHQFLTSSSPRKASWRCG